LAQAALDADATAVGQRFLVATDARRREVYWAAYEARDGVAVRLEDPSVDAPAAVPREGRVVVGHGVQLYPELLGPVVPQAPEHVRGGPLAALAVRRLAAGEGPFPAEPLYLRRPDAVEPGARKRVLAP
jgi:tRNA A37 threonylcarbamoyladenosine modification protein TsaB